MEVSGMEPVSTGRRRQEDDGTGKLYTVTADFRKYVCVEQSIADHSAYLAGRNEWEEKRYAGLAGEKDYRKAVRIIKDGGYATDSFMYRRSVLSLRSMG